MKEVIIKFEGPAGSGKTLCLMLCRDLLKSKGASLLIYQACSRTKGDGRGIMFKTYRLYRQRMLAVKTTGNIDGRYLDKHWLPTDILFKGRTQKEAMKKAQKFWRDGEFGMGRIIIIEEV